MSADNEHRLVSKVIKDREITPALHRGITDAWFLDDDNRKVWSFLKRHYSEYSEVPTVVTVKDHYPNYKVLDVEDSLDYLLDTMVDFRRRLLTRKGLEDAVEQLQGNNHEAALLAMEQTISRVNESGVLGTHEIDLTKNTEERYKEYLAIQNQTFLGIPTGFKDIDRSEEHTSELQSH